jgi:hypothetical protein
MDIKIYLANGRSTSFVKRFGQGFVAAKRTYEQKPAVLTSRKKGRKFIESWHTNERNRTKNAQVNCLTDLTETAIRSETSRKFLGRHGL